MSIYLDYAATTPLRQEVLEEMLPFLRQSFANPDSSHSFGREAAEAVMSARDKIAALLGVLPSEIYFTSGGTEADNWAVRCLGTGKALVSNIEHAAVLSAAPLRESGFCLFPTISDGLLPAELFLPEGTGLVCAMAVNNETGSIQPIEKIAARAHEGGAYFFTDCVQAACSQDLANILHHADAVSLSAHKIGGPKGVGALIVKKGVPIKGLIVGGEQEHGLRAGTLNVAGIVGFSRALELAVLEREAFSAHTARLRDRFEAQILAALPDQVRRDGENRAPNLSHLTFSSNAALLGALDLAGVAASAGAACSAHASAPSHVMRAMGRSKDEAKRGIRFSFSLCTTAEEADRAAAIVIECARRSS